MRAPTLPRCGVCDRTGSVVLHCQQCDEPTCADHIHRYFPAEGMPAHYVCTLCLEERGTPLSETHAVSTLSAEVCA